MLVKISRDVNKNYFLETNDSTKRMQMARKRRAPRGFFGFAHEYFTAFAHRDVVMVRFIPPMRAASSFVLSCPGWILWFRHSQEIFEEIADETSRFTVTL